MLDKSYAKYGKAKPGGDKCRTCRWFRMPRSCELVEGDISPDGWCRFHTEKKGAGAPAWAVERARETR